jgi:hypothetical protein
MISIDTFLCPACKEERYQRVIFLAGEFAYECPCCNSLHIFYENLFPRFQDNFLHDKRWCRYVGTFSEDRFVVVANPKIAEKYIRICQNFKRAEKRLLKVERTILSQKLDTGRYYIGSAYTDHFQEALRGFVRLHEQTQSPSSNLTRNVLILPSDSTYDFIRNDPDKLSGIDEIWSVPLEKKYRWPWLHTENDLKEALSCSYAVTSLLDTLVGTGEVVSKRSGPLPGGKEALKVLLESPVSATLRDNRNTELLGPYVAVLIHVDTNERAGLETIEQLESVVTWIYSCFENPLLIATMEHENDIAKSFQACPSVYLPTVQEQLLFYREFCKGVVGANGSGCNIPALYDLPIFAFVKKRGFPDDFYCFGRMASTYKKAAIPWCGDVEKAENIIEFKVACDKPTRPQSAYEEMAIWYSRFVLPNKYQREGKGWRELIEGFNDQCLKCNTVNFTRVVIPVKTDLCCEYVCEKCKTEYVSYRGLTSLSKRACFLKEDRSSSYSKSYHLTTYSEPHDLSYTIEDISFDPSKPSVLFYCIKASIADLFYMLPTLYHLRCGLGRSKNLIVLVSDSYKDLVPREYADRILGLKENPRLFQGNPVKTNEVLASVRALLVEYSGCVTSNIPGTLPAPPSLYRFFATLLRGPVQERSITVSVFCRLTSHRKWPTEEMFEKLTTCFDRKGYSYRFLVFPSNEGVALPSYLRSVVIDPTIREQIDLLKQSQFCITAHGASEVIAAIANTPVLELEMIPNWWGERDPQPLRFGLQSFQYRKVEGNALTDISLEAILSQLERLQTKE